MGLRTPKFRGRAQSFKRRLSSSKGAGIVQPKTGISDLPEILENRTSCRIGAEFVPNRSRPAQAVWQFRQFLSRNPLKSSIGGVDSGFRNELEGWEDLTKALTKAAENIGVLVMRNKFVGHTVGRRLDENEFRGFALSDPVAPVIFINGQDSAAAQNFTLAHELAHIWIGESGVSNVDLATRITLNKVEQFCNQVAAEFLVPSQEFLSVWDEDVSLWGNVNMGVATFKVSSLVILIRAFELDRIQYPAFKTAFDREQGRFLKKERTDSEEHRSGGPQFWSLFQWRISPRFGETLVRAIRRERTTYTEAAHLLSLSISAFETYLHQESGP